MFASIKSFVSSLADDAEKLFNRVTTKDQLNRVTAAAALIAYADGECDSSEKQKTVQVIQAKLPHFNSSDIAKSWAKAEECLKLDFDFGKGDLLGVISKASEDEKDLLLRVAILIGGADGDFYDNEKNIVREMCNLLGKQPSAFGL